MNTQESSFVKVAVNSWKLVVHRADKVFSRLSEDEFHKEVAPGKNRLVYLFGHLTAINDAMFPILRLGSRLHPELDTVFVTAPDKSAQLPAVEDLKKYWNEVNSRLVSEFEKISAGEWLLRHNAMSEEDYAKDPTRNRLAVLLNRTNHMSYHLGQINLAVESFV
jgi:uncharacterized damage-inducible protein DinB